MTTNLGAPQVADNQASKEITINDAVGRLDASMTERLEPSVDGDFTLTTDDYQSHGLIDLYAGALSANFTVTVPAVRRGLFAVRNVTGYTATFEVSGQPGTAPTVANGASALLFGTEIEVFGF